MEADSLQIRMQNKHSCVTSSYLQPMNIDHHRKSKKSARSSYTKEMLNGKSVTFDPTSQPNNTQGITPKHDELACPWLASVKQQGQ